MVAWFRGKFLFMVVYLFIDCEHFAWPLYIEISIQLFRIQLPALLFNCSLENISDGQRDECFYVRVFKLNLQDACTPVRN